VIEADPYGFVSSVRDLVNRKMLCVWSMWSRMRFSEKSRHIPVTSNFGIMKNLKLQVWDDKRGPSADGIYVGTSTL